MPEPIHYLDPVTRGRADVCAVCGAIWPCPTKLSDPAATFRTPEHPPRRSTP